MTLPTDCNNSTYGLIFHLGPPLHTVIRKLATTEKYHELKVDFGHFATLNLGTD